MDDETHVNPYGDRPGWRTRAANWWVRRRSLLRSRSVLGGRSRGDRC